MEELTAVTHLKSAYYKPEPALAHFYYKWPDNKYFKLCGPVFVPTTQCCHLLCESSLDNMYESELGHVPIKLYLQKQAMGLI